MSKDAIVINVNQTIEVRPGTFVKLFCENCGELAMISSTQLIDGKTWPRECSKCHSKRFLIYQGDKQE